MRTTGKIFFISFIVSCLTLVSLCLFAQSKTKAKKAIKHPITLGFQSGRELLFNSSPLIRSRQSKIHSGVSSSLVLRKPLNAHFKIETGLTYNAIQNAGNKYTPGYNFEKPYSLGIPLTSNYYFCKEKCRFRPSIGAGLQCNLNVNNSNLISPFNTTSESPNNNINYQSGTKYISILFTQGMTFEVNTKIEVNESFHFIPNNTTHIIGIDLGIGYKFP